MTTKEEGSDVGVGVGVGGDADEGRLVKYLPFSSTVDSSFWVRYCQEKLETIQLSEEPLDVAGHYVVSNDGGSHPRLQCQESSLESAHPAGTPATTFPNDRVVSRGLLVGYNTVESFQKVDKNELLRDTFCSGFFSPWNGGNAAAAESSLNSFVLITYADLKRHRVLYWFGIPALLPRSGRSVRAVRQSALRDAWTASDVDHLDDQIHRMRKSRLAGHNDSNGNGNDKDDGNRGLPPYFVRTKKSCLPLSFESHAAVVSEASVFDGDEVVFGFFDPCGPASTTPPPPPPTTTTTIPPASESSSTTSSSQATPPAAVGWPMRNLVAYLCFHLDLGGKTVSVLSYRPRHLRRISSSSDDKVGPAHGGDSVLLRVRIPEMEDYEWDDGETGPAATPAAYSTTSRYRVVGWELNARSKPGPRWVNLSPLLDSRHLAIQAADLNLKLMKWRMIPDLDIDLLQSTGVLLIGAGTLGCSVARTLLGWGIRKMTIVDNGRVSYSNPVRQSLFELGDCDADNGAGRYKSLAAASALRKIAADAEIRGVVSSVPMPGHPSDDTESLRKSVRELDELVRACDAVFLLTDTRESRWLPTVMAAAHDKILVNAALGLDSWLVMRHGRGILQGGGTGGGEEYPESKTRHGCYFCNDVVAPENSTKNRTLDQQCTVTRPGLAPIASSMAVEMMISMLHHRDGSSAPAPKSTASNFATTVTNEGDGGSSGSSSGPLGVIPHQIRGSLVTYTMMTPAVPAFPHCTACSEPVIRSYLHDGPSLVREACQSVDGTYLEDLSGLASFRAEAEAKFADMEYDDDADDWDVDDDNISADIGLK